MPAQEATTPTPAPATLSTESTVADLPVEDNAPASQDLTAQPDDANYYIIAGCFRSEINANKLLKELKAKGYPASIQGRTPKGLHRVCYRGFTDFKAAEKELSRILREENKSAWLINLDYDPR